VTERKDEMKSGGQERDWEMKVVGVGWRGGKMDIAWIGGKQREEWRDAKRGNAGLANWGIGGRLCATLQIVGAWQNLRARPLLGMYKQ